MLRLRSDLRKESDNCGDKTEAYTVLVGNPLREGRKLIWGRILKRLFSDCCENVV